MSKAESALEAELHALRETVETMSQQLAALRDSVHDARGKVNLSMRGQLRCPACGCTKLLHVPQVLDRGESNSRNPMSLDKKGIIFSKPIGAFEVYACTDCGLVEWYSDLSDVEPDGRRIVLIEGDHPRDSGTGPYR